MTGHFPDFIIDHKDGDSLNDKWSNLRRGTTALLREI
ncbi:HNH endonuclease [Vibrio parahaemolyticus]|nr:HNH endonuclease [Vibrio chemaguriensis]MCA2428592.1 HNH endonuclease [Vibrio chemaguriensis]MCA2459022.1 HNH endonuclease [Vibrio alginolyticus]MCA2485993.1 HNH endonuclease [Vibrio alginolyticus]MCA6691542.1 HNH endonuclease [Vibrio parahaemolyticus]